MTLLRIEISLTLPSGANLREHWATKAKRVKAQRNAVILCRHGGAFLPAIAATTRGEALVCLLTRIAPRRLDSDNLAFAFKAIRDQIAEELGVNDGSDAVEWLYAQESGKAAIRVEIHAHTFRSTTARLAQFAPTTPDLNQLAAEPPHPKRHRASCPVCFGDSSSGHAPSCLALAAREGA